MGVQAKADQPVVCSFKNPAYFVDDSTQDEHSTNNAISEENVPHIYVLSDVPHLFKCIRNRLYSSKEFQIGTDKNKLVKWQYYKNLYEADTTRADRKRVCPKLSRNHVNPDNTIKMRVYVMAQVNDSEILF